MKAVLCKDFSAIEDLVYSETEIPSIKDNEVLIDVTAAGVNFPDGLLVQGLYQLKPELPFIPGSEVCGNIRSVGEKVRDLSIGQRVIGICRLGGYAEKVAIPANQVMPIPEQIDQREAAALTTAHATAHHALKQRAQLKAGETILITGAAGGTGLAAVQIAKIMGANVIAACSSDEKCQLAQDNGADTVINYDKQDLKETVKSMTQGRGVDVVYECVGGDIFHACSRIMAWSGRLLVVGFAGGDIPKFPLNLALVKGYSIVGVFWGSFIQHQPKDFIANMQELITWYLQGKVKVNIDKCFDLAKAVDALNYVGQRKVKGKIVLVP